MSDLQLALLGVRRRLRRRRGGSTTWCRSAGRARRGREGLRRAPARRALRRSARERASPPSASLPPPERAARADARRRSTRRTPPPADEELEAAPAAPGRPMLSSRIDTVAVILADDPVIARAARAARSTRSQAHTTPVHVEGIVDEQWQPVEDVARGAAGASCAWACSSRAAAARGRGGDRARSTTRSPISPRSVNAVSQREAPTAAAARARELDRFCADADIEVAVNVVGPVRRDLRASRA